MKGLGIALQVLLWIALAATALTAVLLVAEQRAADRVIDGGQVVSFDFDDLTSLEDANNAVDGATLLLGLLMLAIFVLLIIHLWRAAANAAVLGRTNPPLGAGWAIGAWFIPVGAMVLVPIVYSSAWKGLDPTIAAGDPQWRKARAGALGLGWWIAWVLGSGVFVTGITMRSEDDTGFLDPARYTDGIAAALAGSVVLIVAIVLGVLYLRALTNRSVTWGDHVTRLMPDGPVAQTSDPPAGPPSEPGQPHAPISRAGDIIDGDPPSPPVVSG